MSREKEKPILYKSDVIELYDRSVLCITDLLAIAADKKCDIDIGITSDGRITFKTYEFTKDKMYIKSQEVSSDSISYTEKEVKNK